VPSTSRRLFVGAAALTGLLAAAACSPPEAEVEEETTEAAAATSVEDFGTFEDLVAAAEAEGELNVIALPPDWANYGEVISTFQETYDITVNSDQPDASSQDEINAANQLKGQQRAPDVFDLGQAVADENTDLFAPYQVQTWDEVGEDFKHPDGLWVNDYGGFMSIGFDAGQVPAPTAVEDLLGEEYRGKVALNGDPTQAGAAFAGVMMASLASGGSGDDIAPGVDFFTQLNDAGNFLPLDPTPATIESGQTPVVIDWDYLNVGQGASLEGTVDWQTVVPENAVVGGYYVQAINKDAPHPAAARLWQEFLYSDEGQNLWLGGGARPVRADAMAEAGTIDTEAFDALPEVVGEPVVLTAEQNTAAQEYLQANWAGAIG
jgi:putative spermidine/putrescine transport system substrate-binding protein